MVVLDENIFDQCQIVGKKEKAHQRPIVGVWTFQPAAGELGIITIAHDSMKLWRVDETDSGVIAFSERREIKKWRCGVQSADVTNDGRDMVVLGLDSILYEVVLSDDGPLVIEKDLGYMEAWHIKIAKNKMNYMTTSYSGKLSEIDLTGKFSRREPVQHVKNISTIAYSHDNQSLAIAMNDGFVHIHNISDLKLSQTIESQAMRVRAVVFSPNDEYLLTGGDDKLIKLHSLKGDGPNISNTYCGNRAPIICAVFDEFNNGTRFATGNQAGEVLLWTMDVYTPTHVLPSPHDCVVAGIAFSPSGKHIFSVGDDKQLVCYNIPYVYVDNGLNSGNLAEENIGYDEPMLEEGNGPDEPMMEEHNGHNGHPVDYDGDHDPSLQVYGDVKPMIA